MFGSIMLIGLGIDLINKKTEGWPFAIVLMMISILLLYSVIYFRIVNFDDEYLYISGWFAAKGIPLKNITNIERKPFLISPPMAGKYNQTVYKVEYVNEHQSPKKFYFVLEISNEKDWVQFKSQLSFKFDDTWKW